MLRVGAACRGGGRAAALTARAPVAVVMLSARSVTCSSFKFSVFSSCATSSGVIAFKHVSHGQTEITEFRARISTRLREALRVVKSLAGNLFLQKHAWVVSWRDSAGRPAQTLFKGE